MGADTTVPITAGSGTAIKTYAETTGSANVQYVRSHTCTSSTLDSWTTSTTAATSRVAADETRVALTFINDSATVVYARPDATAPTSTAYYIRLENHDVYEVPREWVELAWSVVADNSGVGNLLIWKGTAA